ncbi:hypothetical protein [Cryptosporangium sp. NPDC051539]|uniref:hypothetical protein n=1 Tax=Cryptosporangium sp. NPDC051539 TaxID=3363962 RepID=UPI0037A896B1
MATLAQVRAGIRTVLEAAIPTLTVYPYLDSVVTLPAAVVMVGDGVDYRSTSGRSHMEWPIDLIVMTSKALVAPGQIDLDELIDIDGDKSIPRALFDSDLGLPHTQAHVAYLRDYGGQWEAAGDDHIGAVLRVPVHTRGAF